MPRIRRLTRYYEEALGETPAYIEAFRESLAFANAVLTGPENEPYRRFIAITYQVIAGRECNTTEEDDTYAETMNVPMASHFRPHHVNIVPRPRREHHDDGDNEDDDDDDDENVYPTNGFRGLRVEHRRVPHRPRGPHWHIRRTRPLLPTHIELDHVLEDGPDHYIPQGEDPSVFDARVADAVRRRAREVTPDQRIEDWDRRYPTTTSHSNPAFDDTITPGERAARLASIEHYRRHHSFFSWTARIDPLPPLPGRPRGRRAVPPFGPNTLPVPIPPHRLDPDAPTVYRLHGGGGPAMTAAGRECVLGFILEHLRVPVYWDNIAPFTAADTYYDHDLADLPGPSTLDDEDHEEPIWGPTEVAEIINLLERGGRLAGNRRDIVFHFTRPRLTRFRQVVGRRGWVKFCRWLNEEPDMRDPRGCSIRLTLNRFDPGWVDFERNIYD